jgi:mono/diheme cytochrome c family protein
MMNAQYRMLNAQRAESSACLAEAGTVAWCKGFCAVLLCATFTVTAAAPPDDVFFVDKVWPILKEKCMGCHGDRPEKIKGDYDMRTYAGMLEGGESEMAAIIKGQPEKSPFYVALTWEDEDLQMPPKENDRLTKEQMAVIHEWIKRGAPYSDPNVKREIAWGDVTEDGMVVETAGGLDDSWTYRRYAVDGIWAYQPIKRFLPPQADVHPIDAFVSRKLKEKGLKPAEKADKRNLLRRATFALTGLPPTPAEVADFDNDKSPDAFAKVTDRLLASNHYGEKMAQHWLDVVRYADTSGFSNDFERPTAWRYRDYVVRSFNADKPYNQFAREQLAGDELPEVGEEGKIAAGFLRMGPWEHTGMSVAAETRQLFLDDVTHSVGVTFLGQQLRCAKCHDHKFDPIPQADYYRFQALFATVQFADLNLGFLKNENTSQMAGGKARMKKRLANADNRDKYVQQEVDKLVAQELARRGGKMSEADRKAVYDKAMKDQKTAVGKATRKQKAYYQRESMRYEPYAYTVYNGPNRTIKSQVPIMAMPKPGQMKGGPEQIHVLAGGSLESPTERVDAGVISVVNGFAQPKAKLPNLKIPQTMSGRRSARWANARHIQNCWTTSLTGSWTTTGQ